MFRLQIAMMPRPENIMFDMDLQLEYSPKTVKLIDFDTCPGTEAMRNHRSWRKGVTLYAVVGGIFFHKLFFWGRADQISMICENHFIALFLFRK